MRQLKEISEQTGGSTGEQGWKNRDPPVKEDQTTVSLEIRPDPVLNSGDIKTTVSTLKLLKTGAGVAEGEGEMMKNIHSGRVRGWEGLWRGPEH